MSLQRLRWISVIAPTVFVVVFEAVTRSLYSDLLPGWVHVVVALGAVSVAAFVFSTFVFASVSRLERQIVQRNRRLATLNALAADVGEANEVEEVATTTARNVRAVLDANAAGLALVSEEDGVMRMAGQDGLGLGPASETSARALGTFDCECRNAVALDRPVLTEDSHETASCAGMLKSDQAYTCVAAPVRSKGRAIGAIVVARERSRPLDQDDVELVAAVGAQVGTILENAQLFRKAEALAVLQEREHVAREVHDGMGQTLGYVNVQTGIVARLLHDGEIDKAKVEVAEMAQATRNASQDLRQAIADLRTPLSSTGGLRRTIREHAERFSRETGIPCHFEGHRGPPAVISPSTEVQVLRIVQEALANVRKHAPSSQVHLTVEVRAGKAWAIIRDSGPGFDVQAAGNRDGRFGLRTMRERAESVGGALRIESSPGTGTMVEVAVPLDGADAG